MGSILYFFKEAIRGFYQAKLMTFVAIISIAVSLCFMNLIAIAFFNLENLMQKSTDQADMVVYLKDEINGEYDEMDKLVEKVRTIPSVRQVHVINKDSAWERFSQIYGKEMLESVDENPLPISLEIYVKDKSRSQEQIEKLTNVLRRLPQIETVHYSKEWISLIEKFRMFFWGTACIVAVIINFILYFMIANTIKLTIYARKELVAHMQVVGATSFFIQMPFVLEGILQGIIGGIFCTLVISLLRLLLFGFSIDWGPQPLLLLITLFFGVLYGWLGSMGAVRKFLA